MVERQLVELVTQVAVEFAAKMTVQCHSGIAVVIGCRVAGRTGVLGILGPGNAGNYLFLSQWLQAIVVPESQIRGQTPNTRQR
ncbi:MAG TPA: hypothetical protein VNS88_00320, partial [Nitrospiraceae bacterium]|nr:hypothetical protein [Nitrospiraceae bacterium]